MPISAKAAAELVGWERSDIRTLLYTIALDGADSKEDWDYDLICEIICSAASTMQEKNAEEAKGIALDLAVAIGAIQDARRLHRRRSLAKAKKTRAQKAAL